MCQNNFSEAYQLFRSAVQEEPENTAVSSIVIRDFNYCNQPNIKAQCVDNFFPNSTPSFENSVDSDQLASLEAS